jgi:hypothetical protein
VPSNLTAHLSWHTSKFNHPPQPTHLHPNTAPIPRNQSILLSSSFAVRIYNSHNTINVLVLTYLILLILRFGAPTIRSQIPSPRQEQTSKTRLQTRPSLGISRIPRNSNISLPCSGGNKLRSSSPSPSPPLEFPSFGSFLYSLSLISFISLYLCILVDGSRL